MTRRFLLKLGNVLAAGLALGTVFPSLLFWWRSSKGRPAGEQWVDVGSPHELPQREWVERQFSFEQINRWRQEITRELVYVHRDGRDLTVLSPICPHARCVVRVRDDGFVCPCHQSAFDASGAPLDGPSLRPLDALEWKVENGRLLVNYQHFRPGVATTEILPT